ncbi:protein Dok-7-like isoform X1 [Pseudochaenichthys georgianus]|uniref:protein Dok-7-like isoform X1 n=1 Tax=Pseudochaenichthys georgianus TaxID=52239 RepID=UPI00146E6014|nr:protein Dok-7-like isoform X1 [Pseudochaenichthys georgianus]
MTDSVVVEGYARLRDGKKWKTRWVVLRKPSPVADCLVLLVFKDKSDKAQGNKERASVTLEEICGVETGQWFEGVAFTLTILCLNQTALLGFDSKEALQAWDARLRYSLGEVHRFSVGVLPGTKLGSGPATLHLCNNLLALARDVPPAIIGHWNLPDLRRYGPVPNGFVFEGGTRCGYWAGVFLLSSADSEQISFLFDCIVRGISPTRGPFGLRPILPDPSGSQTNSEEKLNHDAQELEKRLSMLSHRSSTVSYCASAGGDDRSMSGSSDASDTSQSESSMSSRMAIWTEPSSNPSESVGHVGAKLALQSMEKLSVTQGGVTRPAPKTPRPLQEIGRQSSSDSGIATGSHSSYSGSFSSYTGSLDLPPGEDFGSVFSLPPHLAQDLSPCTCSTAPAHEYRTPSSLRYLYDSPRSVLQEGGGGATARDNEPSTLTKDATASPDPTTDSAQGDQSSAKTPEGHSENTDTQSTNVQLDGPSEESKKTKVTPSSDTSAPKTIVTICSVCGGFKGTPYIPVSGPAAPAIPDQSADKSPCSPCANAARRSLERRCASPGPGSCPRSETPAVRTSEDSLLPRKGREKLASLLAELLGSPEAKTNSLNLYESMSPRFGNELKSAPNSPCVPTEPQPGKRHAIYENCLKCRADHCHPPPRVAPAEMFRNRNTLTSQPFPTGLKNSQEQEAAADEEALHQTPSERSQIQGQHEEINVPTVASEDKRLNSKEERRRADPAYEIMERNSEAEEKSKYELMGSYSQQRLLQETEGAVLVFPPEAALPERPRREGVTYVNIPVSPTSKKQLNYMELELLELGPRGPVAHPPPHRKSSSKYAQIDITATETAHRVGVQHALGREEGLLTLELRKKGTPH